MRGEEGEERGRGVRWPKEEALWLNTEYVKASALLSADKLISAYFISENNQLHK